MFDFEEFAKVSIGGTPLILVIMGLVTLCRKIKWMKGQRLLIASLGIGFAFGMGYQIAAFHPHDFAGWFAATSYSLLLGLSTSGVYDTGKHMTGADKIISGEMLSAVLNVDLEIGESEMVTVDHA